MAQPHALSSYLQSLERELLALLTSSECPEMGLALFVNPEVKYAAFMEPVPSVFSSREDFYR